MKSCKGKASEVKADPIPDSEPENVEKKQNILPILLIVCVIGVGVAIGFLKFRKNKPKSAPMPDFDEENFDDETEVENGDE